ncbi:MAG: hypothetical protein JXB88_21860 [Spirochaetales bacterium]|nr:hypothetical protein [Spirochaetales bacterium]
MADPHRWGPLKIKVKKGAPYTWSIKNPPEPESIPTGDIQVINNTADDIEFFLAGILKGIIPSGHKVTYTEKAGSYILYTKYHLLSPVKDWEKVIDLTEEGFIWDLEDYVEGYPSENCRVWNFENNAEDQHGIDDWDTKDDILYSQHEKFGKYSLYANNEQKATLISVSISGTTGKSQGVGLWIFPSYITESFSTYFFYLSEVVLRNFIVLGIDKNSTGTRFFVMIRKEVTDTIIYSNYIEVNKWHYVAFSYEEKSNTLYLICNKDILSVNPFGIWGTGSMAIQIHSENTKEAQYYIDEVIVIHDQFLDPSIFAQHYQHNVSWGKEYEH